MLIVVGQETGRVTMAKYNYRNGLLVLLPLAVAHRAHGNTFFIVSFLVSGGSERRHWLR